MRIRCAPVSSRCFEPVTVPAAPRKVNDDMGLDFTSLYYFLNPSPVRTIVPSLLAFDAGGSCRRPSPMSDVHTTAQTPGNLNRRNFIKGVIAAGAAVSSANYLF